MSKAGKTYACIALLMLFTGNAIAALIATSYPGEGYSADFVVRDTATNLEWRRFADSRGYSSDTLEITLTKPGNTGKWRKATRDEVLTLLRTNLDTDSALGTHQTFPIFFDLFGTTFSLGDGLGGQNLFSYARLTPGPTGSIIDLFMHPPNIGTASTSGSWRADFITAPDPDSRVAHWIVREASPIPVPTASILLISGIVAVQIEMRRLQKTPNQPLERTPPRCALRRRSRAR